MKILVVNGPNLNMLGIREPEIYGTESYEALCSFIKSAAPERKIDVEIFQSNSEGAIVDAIQGAYGNADGIVINAAAYTHYSYAIFDALKAVGLPAVEVHISDVSNREPFRKISVIEDACIARISGRGFQGYVDAIDLLMGDNNEI